MLIKRIFLRKYKQLLPLESSMLPYLQGAPPKDASMASGQRKKAMPVR